MLRLYGMGAIAVEKMNPSKAKRVEKYLHDVHEQFPQIDLRRLAEGAEVSPEVDYKEWKQIAGMTPTEVIQKANEQVTKSMKSELERRVKEGATNKMELLGSQREGVPNSKFDGRSY